MGRHRRRRSSRAFVVPSLSVLGGLAGLAVLVGVPVTGHGDPAPRAQAPQPRKVAATSTMAPSVPLAATPFDGTPAVGALFTTDGDRPAGHFCTASVVDSPAGNLVITAAHCVTGPRYDARHLAFVPGLRDDVKPYGVWSVTKVIVDDVWAATADPDHDVAFLTVARDGGLARIQDFTGANRLGSGRPSGVVRVIGYPNDRGRPIRCQNRTRVFGNQQRFDCKDLPGGTSGGPFVAGAASGEGIGDGTGTVVGVVGGHDEGGLTPDISYSIVFGRETKALYDTAVAGA